MMMLRWNTRQPIYYALSTRAHSTLNLASGTLSCRFLNTGMMRIQKVELRKHCASRNLSLIVVGPE